jgi:hypothetical protein
MKEIIGLISLSSLTPPPFIAVSVPNQESEWSSICVLEVSVFGNVPTVWQLFAFYFLWKLPACSYTFGQCTVLNNDEFEDKISIVLAKAYNLCLM